MNGTSVKEVSPTEPVDDRAAPNAAVLAALASDFVLVHAGQFSMGSPPGDPERSRDETPHLVTLTHDFYLQAHEVTQAQWRALIGNNPAFFSVDWASRNPLSLRAARDAGYEACVNEDCPVESVTWAEAVAFANALSEREGLTPCYRTSGRHGRLGAGCTGLVFLTCRADFGFDEVVFAGLDCTGYRLPTEAEWEYAARAGSLTSRPCGEDPACLNDVGWYAGNAGGRTHPVGRKRPNALGLFDMLGNVDEWVNDYYGDYPTGPVTDPLGPDSGRWHTWRGGDWFAAADLARSATRGHEFALGAEPRLALVGFRLARTAPQEGTGHASSSTHTELPAQDQDAEP